MKKLYLFVMSFVLILNPFVPALPWISGPAGLQPLSASPSIFPDVPESHWAAKKIKVLAGNKCIYGYADGAFRPENLLTRAELAAVLVNVSGEKPLPAGKPSFSDVDRNQWFYSAVEAGKKFFLTDPSLLEGSFRPYDFVTRQEAAAAIVTAKNLKPGEDGFLQEIFADYESVSPQYRGFVSIAVRERLVSGYPDRTFRPESPLTRAEAASLVYEAFFSDISIDTLIKTGEVYFFENTEEGFQSLADSLDGRFGSWEGVKINFYVKETAVSGIPEEKLILVFARVDPFKYFTFSDVIFKPDPGKVREYAERISAAVSEKFPERRNLVMVGFFSLIFYDTVAEVYGSEYTRYSPPDGGWRVERFYAGAMAMNGKVTETWLEPQKS